MEYNVGDTFIDAELGLKVQCVEDGDMCTCSDCIYGFGDESCPERSYDNHPCYHSDRKDGKDVHFIAVHKI